VYCCQTVGWIKIKHGMEVDSAQATLCSMGTQLLPQKGGTDTTQFSAHVGCGQTAGWIKMPLGMEVHLGPRDLALDGDPAPLPAKEGDTDPNFRSMSIVAKRLEG